MILRRPIGVFCIAGLLASCSLAPDYKAPDTSIPKSYKEAGDWIPAAPAKADKDKGPWWRDYNDSDLNGLEDKVSNANQDLKAALAAYEGAKAVAASAYAGYFPTVTGDASAIRQNASRTTYSVITTKPFNTGLAEGEISYELDVWGKVRNMVKAGESRARASAADLATMELSLHAELAIDYFTLRGYDAMQQFLDESVDNYAKALKLTEDRHKGGIASASDVDQAQTQLQDAKTQAADMHLKRAQMEHAIAILAGEQPSSFSIAVKKYDTPLLPLVVTGLPSVLLEQRPDISAAALRLEGANADIGVARAAYYPDFTLSALGGYESAYAPKLFTAPSLLWSLGPSAMVTLFDGGRIKALNAQARASYDQTVANYRQAVLTAFQQVEDNLVALHQLDQENTSQTDSTHAAERVLDQTRIRYKGGIVSYLTVTSAQSTALQADIALQDITTRRLIASVMLVKSLGGGWHEKSEVKKSNDAKNTDAQPAKTSATQ